MLPLARVRVAPSRSLAVRARHLFRQRRLCSTNGSEDVSLNTRFWQWTTQQRPSWKESPTEAVVAFCVFGVTGSTSVALVRPTLKSVLGLEGSMREGPWSYRITSLVAVSPIYASLLVTFGTLAGRHRFFAYMATKIFGRFVPRAVMDRVSRAFAFCFPGSVIK